MLTYQSKLIALIVLNTNCINYNLRLFAVYDDSELLSLKRLIDGGFMVFIQNGNISNIENTIKTFSLNKYHNMSLRCDISLLQIVNHERERKDIDQRIFILLNNFDWSGYPKLKIEVILHDSLYLENIETIKLIYKKLSYYIFNESNNINQDFLRLFDEFIKENNFQKVKFLHENYNFKFSTNHRSIAITDSETHQYIRDNFLV